MHGRRAWHPRLPRTHGGPGSCVLKWQGRWQACVLKCQARKEAIETLLKMEPAWRLPQEVSDPPSLLAPPSRASRASHQVMDQ